ncbi:MAG: hypothetical protein JKY50_00295 [Oleispira sp.]|nr:hypothetical protein [Oleispira sp.]
MDSSNDGVCGHSSDLYWKEKVIFSIDYQDVERKWLEFTLILGAKDIWYKELQGVYEGQAERSLVVLDEDFFSDEFPMSYLKYQECVLHLSEPEKKYNGRPTGTLLYNGDGNGYLESHMGLFTHVAQREALDNGDYTYDPSNASYFICKEE